MELQPYIICEDRADPDAAHGRSVSINTFVHVSTEQQARETLKAHQRDRRHFSKSDAVNLRLFKLVAVD